MGFFHTRGAKGGEKRLTGKQKAFQDQKELLNRVGAKKLEGCGLQPEGSDDPMVYILSSNPTNNQLRRQTLTKGDTASLLRRYLGRDYFYHECRHGSIVRSKFTAFGEVNDDVEIEQWRGLTEQDIEDTKPAVVIACGGEVTRFFLGSADINGLHGRMIPHKIGSHTFWVLPIYDPRFVISKDHEYFENEFEVCVKVQLSKLMDRIETGTLPTPIVYDKDYDKGIEIIMGEGREDLHRVEDVLNDMLLEPLVSMDYECQNLRPYLDDSRMLTTAVGTFERTVAFPLDHPRAWNNKTRREVLGIWGDYLMQSPRMVVYNATMEQEWTAHYYGYDRLRRVQWEDLMACMYNLDSRKGHLSLDASIRYLCGFDLKKLSGKMNKSQMIKEPLDKVLKYNGRDTKWTAKGFDIAMDLIEEEGLQDPYDTKVRNSAALTGMQVRGMPRNESALEELQDKLTGQIAEVDCKLNNTREVKDFKRMFGEQFNPASPDHNVWLFRDVLERKEGFKDGKDKEGKQKFSTDEAALSSMPEKECPAAPLVLQRRGLTKIKSTYVDGLLTPASEYINPEEKKAKGLVYGDGLLHPSYNGMFTGTGRLSAQDPNSQNFPKRKNVWVREPIAPPEGFRVVSLDFGQIEARGFGFASRDPNFCDALWSGLDVHLDWAIKISNEYPQILDRIYDDYYDKVNKLIDKGMEEYDAIIKCLRGDVKNQWVFPQFFGAGFKSCAASMQIPEHNAEVLMEQFWHEFIGVKEWQDETLARAYRDGYVKTMGGFRRAFPLSKQKIINTPIQGTAAEIVLEGLCLLSEESALLEDVYVHPIMQIHDDLTFIMPEDGMAERIEHAAEIMTGVYERFDYVNVPLIVEAEEGPNWGKQSVFGEYSSEQYGHVRAQ